MRVAVVGSRGLAPDIAPYLPEAVSCIISGGARGVDSAARSYALAHRIPLLEFLPEYALFGSQAPLVRNRRIAEEADLLLAFWDQSSRGTAHIVALAHTLKKPVWLFCLRPGCHFSQAGAFERRVILPEDELGKL